MSTILSTRDIKHIRKDTLCFGCGRKFKKGSSMRVDNIAECGHIWCCYLCPTCDKIASDMGWDDEFGFSDLREEALEMEENIKNEIC